MNNLACLHSAVKVKINEPIGPIFFVAIHMTPKVNGNFKVDNFAMEKCRFF